MAETEEGTAGKEFNVETPLGKFSSKGYHLGNLLQIVAAMLLGLMAFMLWEMRIEAKSQNVAITSIVASASTDKADHDKMTKAIDKTAEAQEVTSYILTLTQADRERLRLQMPDSLRRRAER
jgi:hypothetical protein